MGEYKKMITIIPKKNVLLNEELSDFFKIARVPKDVRYIYNIVPDSNQRYAPVVEAVGQGAQVRRRDVSGHCLLMPP